MQQIPLKQFLETSASASIVVTTKGATKSASAVSLSTKPFLVNTNGKRILRLPLYL